MRAVTGILLMTAVVLTAACTDRTATDEPDSVNAGTEQGTPAPEAAATATQAEPQAQAGAEKFKKELVATAPTLTALEEGNAYLYINSQKPTVKVLESGLQFEILEQGDGRSPGPTSRVVTHYHGTFINGEVFDSSVERGQPAEFPVNRVIAGWTEALQMMKEGDLWRLAIPAKLAYGERGSGARIPPNSTLVFEVELIEVKD